MQQPAPSDYLRALFDAMPSGVLLADDHAIYVDANQAACQLLGRPRDQLVGRHVSDLVAPGRRVEVDVQWRAFLRDGNQSGLFDLHLPDGRIQRCEFTARTSLLPGLHVSFMRAAAAPAAGAPPSAGGLLTVCAWTKRILDQGSWVPLEDYLSRHHGITVTHGMCPEAFKHLMAELEHLPPPLDGET